MVAIKPAGASLPASIRKLVAGILPPALPWTSVILIFPAVARPLGLSANLLARSRPIRTPVQDQAGILVVADGVTFWEFSILLLMMESSSILLKVYMKPQP